MLNCREKMNLSNQIENSRNRPAANFSTGIDVVSLKRAERSFSNARILRSVFTAGEIKRAFSMREPERHLAGRFAAKEAFVKALSKGILSGIRLKDIEVTAMRGGQPSFKLGKVPGHMVAGRNVHLSLSYTSDFAFALVVIG